ncbi:MAG: transglutaminase-like domain-containing protein [Bacteroidetes bacterium]|nr:transglutaminase-like domain-containing protein [Bacteroidota bacterium]MBU2508562.1 transglutaminase-like domain-containing protein [Bacteroidota bacterium]
MYLKKIVQIIIGIMILLGKTYSQESFDLFGFASYGSKNGFRLNSFEKNAGNFSHSKNWELATIFGGEMKTGEQISNNIYLISLANKLDKHYLYSRFTPGYVKEFVIKTGSTITLEDSTNILQNSIKYEEKFGLGYAYSIAPNISAGFSLRYFENALNTEKIEFYFSDTLNTLLTSNEKQYKKYWRGDLGITYSYSDFVRFNLSTANLFIFNEDGSFSENGNLNLRTNKSVLFTADLFLSNGMSSSIGIESSGSGFLSFNVSHDLFYGVFDFGVSGYHDKFQQPFISTVMPHFNFRNELFSAGVVWVNYLQNRSGSQPLSKLSETGMHSIINNQFSADKILLNLNFALSFKQEKSVEFVEVKVLAQIYPTLSDEYLEYPFAVASVKNLTDKKVTVKPSSFIQRINSGKVYSPAVIIPAFGEAEVPFYTIIENDEIGTSSRDISQANFYLSTQSSDEEDEIQKPILIHNKNAWDGKVENLNYFVMRDYSFSSSKAKTILKEKEQVGNSEIEILSDIRTLFNSFIKNMNYVSDPRTSFEYVQFPEQTFELKGGDCDDLSVAFSSLLESIGIATAFVDYVSADKISHVSLLINIKLPPEKANLITKNDKKYFIRENSNAENEIWIPLEMTSLSDFETSWNLASEKFYREGIVELGIAKGNVRIIDIY